MEKPSFFFLWDSPIDFVPLALDCWEMIPDTATLPTKQISILIKHAFSQAAHSALNYLSFCYFFMKTPEHARSYFSELYFDHSKSDKVREVKSNRLYSVVSDLHKIFGWGFSFIGSCLSFLYHWNYTLHCDSRILVLMVYEYVLTFIRCVQIHYLKTMELRSNTRVHRE